VAANAQVCQILQPEQKEAVLKAAALSRQYLAFKSTAAVRDHLIGLAKEHGFLGMLARTTVPFQHSGFALSVLTGPSCCDLQFLHTNSQGLAQQLQAFVAAIKANNDMIYGAARLSPVRERPTLLQSVVDLLCHDPDAVKLALAPPEQRAQARQGIAASAFLDMAAAATALASATTRGDSEGAARAAAAAYEAAQAAAGAVASGSVPDATSGVAVLQRGSGVVLIVPMGWSSRAKPLEKGTVGGGKLTHWTVVQLMEALVLTGGEQAVSVRVASEFVCPGEPLTGNWTKKAFNLRVLPETMVLLSSQARHQLGKQFRGDADAAKGYMTLFPSFTDAAIGGALGELPVNSVSCSSMLS
jgi:hypothetical protein